MEANQDTVYSYYKFNLGPDPEDERPGKFGYIPKNRYGFVCVRTQRPPKDHNGPDFEYRVSYSFCSPEDNFNRRVARKIADDRSKTERKNCVATFRFKERKKLGDVVQSALNMVCKKNNVLDEVIKNEKFHIKLPEWITPEIEPERLR